MTANTESKPPRYLFDEVFSLDGSGAPQATATVSTAVHEAAVETARKEGHAAGLAEGRRQVEDSTAARIASSLERLTAGLNGLVERADTDRREIEAAAVELAHCTATRLVPELIAREPAAELGALLDSCLTDIRDVPHIAVRVSEELVEEMRERIDKAAARAGFNGTVIVLGEPDIAIGDGRIEWADGGLIRNIAETQKAIDVAIADYLASKGVEHKLVHAGPEATPDALPAVPPETAGAAPERDDTAGFTAESRIATDSPPESEPGPETKDQSNE